MKNKLVCLLGMSASGKDSLYRVLVKEYEFKGVVSTTTRPMRTNEKDGIDYYFVGETAFSNLIKENKLVEYRYYNTIENGQPATWHYGITKDEIDLEKDNHVVVCDLKGLQDLTKYFGEENIISVYIHASEKSRRLRAIIRDTNFEEAEWQRRLKDDEEKFKGVFDIVDFDVINDDLTTCVNDLMGLLRYMLTRDKYN